MLFWEVEWPNSEHASLAGHATVADQHVTDQHPVQGSPKAGYADRCGQVKTLPEVLVDRKCADCGDAGKHAERDEKASPHGTLLLECHLLPQNAVTPDQC
jgi:hypothetical protein